MILTSRLCACFVLYVLLWHITWRDCIKHAVTGCMQSKDHIASITMGAGVVRSQWYLLCGLV